VIKTTTTYTTKNPVSRELIFDSPETITTINRSHRHQSPSYETRTIESTSSSAKRNVTYTDDGLYGKPRRTISPSPTSNQKQYHVTETRTRTMSPTPKDMPEKYITETRTINNEIVPMPKNNNANFNEIVRVENSTGPNALNDIQLSDEILPRPKTKVTTTIRTYTYEIPDDGIIRADRDPPKNNAMFYKTERNERNVNYYPNSQSPLTIQEVPPREQSTAVYKYSSSTSSSQAPPQIGDNIPPGGITIYPPQSPTTIVKTETINTTNKQYRSPTYSTGNNYPPSPEVYHPTNGYPPSHQHKHPNEVVVYKTTTTTNTHNVHRSPEHEPMLHPFPVDGPIITEVDGNPPKRVEDLMASFGDTGPIHYTNKRVQIAEKPLTSSNMSTTQTKVYSSESKDDKNNKTAVVPSKNLVGPPVYYPPNHELFASKEESGYRSQVNNYYFIKLILFIKIFIFREDGRKAAESTCTNRRANRKVAANPALLWFHYGMEN
jgi:hypothetical protein